MRVGWHRWWRGLVAVVPAIVAGCLLSPQPDPPGWGDAVDGGARDDAGTGADVPDEAFDGWPAETDYGPPPDASGDSEGEADGELNYDLECPTDPSDGRTGEACDDDGDCGDGFGCVVEYTGVDTAGDPYTDYAGGYCVPELPAGESCRIGVDGSCPEGARCVPTGPGEAPRCLDACSVADRAGALYGANCDCRAGYRCDLSLEVCLPGCVADHECCAAWTDDDADGIREVGEFSRVDGCGGICDPHTFECVYPGAPGARIGDTCSHGSECPAGARCWRSSRAEREGLSGICLQERCDLPGRDCPVDSACVTKDPGFGFASFCVRPCKPDAAPGTPGASCGAGTICIPWVLDEPAAAAGACLPEIW